MATHLNGMNDGEYKRRKNMAKAILKDADTTRDGHLTAAEIIARTAIDVAKPIRTQQEQLTEEAVKTLNNPSPYLVAKVPIFSTIIDNQAVLDRQQFAAHFSQVMNLPPFEVDTLLKQVFPKGVDSVKLSDVCQSQPELNCTPLPNEKIQVSLAKGRAL